MSVEKLENNLTSSAVEHAAVGAAKSATAKAGQAQTPNSAGAPVSAVAPAGTASPAKASDELDDLDDLDDLDFDLEDIEDKIAPLAL